MRKSVRSVIFLFLPALFGCKTNLLVLEDVLPKAKHQDLAVSFKQNSLDNFMVNFNVVYEITNPYKKDLPIPDHSMGIYVNGKNIGLSQEQTSLSVPAKSSKQIEYKFTLNTEKLKTLMGKNNKITFNTSMDLDLSAFSDMLPNYQLGITKDFDIETSEFKPLINNLFQKRIGKFNLSYEHSTQVKIPAPPSIKKSSEPIEITLLGSGIDLIDPNAIKNALVPFGDLLVNGELAGLKDPFIDAIIDLTITVPDPTLTEWNRTRDIRMENYLLDLLRPFDNQITDKWNHTKSLLYQPTTFPITDYFVENFINPHIDNQASVKWNNFKMAYNQLKTTVLPDKLPGPQTRGFEIAIPFAFKNENEFPISIPIFRSSVMLTGGSPFTLYVKPKNMNQVNLNEVPSNQAQIPAKAEETLYVVFSFDMKAFNQGIYSLFMKNQFESNLKGILSYDFGYGPLYIGYDLEKMQLNYK